MPTAPYYIQVDGKKVRVPGTTTVIGRFKESGGLIHWAWNIGIEGKDYRDVRDSAGGSGTMAHEMVERSIRGEKDPTKRDEDWGDVEYPLAVQAYEAYEKWASMSKLEIVDTEMHLVSNEFRFGGTPDAVGYVNGEFCLLDWKTGNKLYSDSLIQLSCYAHLWNFHNPDAQLTGGFHLCRFSKDHADFHHHHFSELDDAWEAFKLMRKLYDLDKVLKKRAA